MKDILCFTEIKSHNIAEARLITKCIVGIPHMLYKFITLV